MIEDLDGNVGVGEGARGPRWLDPCPGAMRIAAALALAQRIEHERRPVIELQCEPIPPRLARGEISASPFPVEPCESLHREGLPAARQATAHRDPRNGVVVARRAC